MSGVKNWTLEFSSRKNEGIHKRLGEVAESDCAYIARMNVTSIDILLESLVLVDRTYKLHDADGSFFHSAHDGDRKGREEPTVE